MEGPSIYRITVQGQLGERWADWFDGLDIALTTDNDGLPITTLTGPADQAALHGIFVKIRDLNLPLIAVCRLSGPGVNAGRDETKE